MVAMSMADGYARATGNPQAVIVHVDVGTQALGCAVHNAHIARSPVLVFAGLCPATAEGEERGSRTEFVNYLQDIPDQAAIVRQYCRYTNEIRNHNNIKQMVNRALQFATSDPKGPVYLYAAREVLERELEPYQLNQKVWSAVRPSGLPQEGVEEVAAALVDAVEPLVVTGYSGRNREVPPRLVELADLIPGLRVLDTSIGDMCFPADHPGWLSGRYSAHPSIESADVILVLDCDVPWVPVQCKPKENAKIYHIDVDPLKKGMSVHYIDAIGRWQVDANTAVKQLVAQVTSTLATKSHFSEETTKQIASRRKLSYDRMVGLIAVAANPRNGPNTPLDANLVAAALKRKCPPKTIFAVEAVTNTFAIYDQLQCTVPGSYIASGATGLGWTGGASLGIKLATVSKPSLNMGKEASESTFVTQITGDGTFLFSAPSSVYWISARYHIPILVIVLNNKGWNAPRVSMQLVHPRGEGSGVSNRHLNISFDTPVPDYGGIAKAASGGCVWTETASTTDELERALEQAVQIVKGGRTAVVDCRVQGIDPTD